MKTMQIRSLARLVLAITFPIAALAQLNSNATVNAGQNFSFDSGTTVGTGGDIQFTGTSITFVGSAKGGSLTALGITGASGYAGVTQAVLTELAAFASTSPIAASSVTAGSASGTIIALETNGGNSAKFLITAISASSISFQFTTYESGTGGGTPTPTVTAVVSGSSVIPGGFPNSGVAPSSLIEIQGTGLTAPNTQAVLQDSTKGLPTTLNGTSVSITVGGKTVTPALYYTCSVSCGNAATQLAAELPAATPVGTGTITVTYNGTPSAAAPINVVATTFGIDNYAGNTAVLTDAVSGAILTYTASAKPGEIVILWGTGLGADPADSDTTYITNGHAINTPVQIYVGGVQVTNIAYAGTSVYPGVDVIGFTIPAGVPNGCYVPIVLVTGSSPGVTSNTPTIPLMNNGGVCSDSAFGLNGTQINTLNGQSTVSGGSVIVGQVIAPATSGSGTQTENAAIAVFEQSTGGSFSSGGSIVSEGGCIISETVVTGTPPTTTGLNAGTITVTGPTGGPVTLTSNPALAGEYVALLAASGITSTGGTFTFNGSGGSGANSVGPFTVAVTLPNPLLTWTNQSAAATVTRSQGLQVTWNGGTPGTFVIITGNSSGTSTNGTYTCFAPQSALQFTVPSYILGSLPAGTGTTTLENGTNYTTFTATGLSYGAGFGYNGVQVSSTYK